MNYFVIVWCLIQDIMKEYDSSHAYNNNKTESVLE